MLTLNFTKIDHLAPPMLMSVIETEYKHGYADNSVPRKGQGSIRILKVLVLLFSFQSNYLVYTEKVVCYKQKPVHKITNNTSHS